MALRLLKISVRELVGHALRCGDLVRGGFVSAERLTAGTRAHQRVQRARPAGYQAEVPVTQLVERDGVLLEIGGRVDGLLVEDDLLLLEEIKSTEADLDPDAVQEPVHWAQAKVYAWIVATQAQRAVIRVRLTYVRLEPWGQLELEEEYAQAALAAFADELVASYLRWAQVYAEWCGVRDASIARIRFPFATPRPGQPELMQAVTGTLQRGDRLFAQAPTGIGKTLSVLLPAIRSLATGESDRIFYLTPRTVVRTVAEGAVDELRRVGLRLRSLTLTARQRICFQGQGRDLCDPAQCPYARGYFDRLGAALDEARHTEAFPRAAVETLARRHQLCPFELSLELSLWSDLIICDYNYVFDPRAYLRRFFAEGGARYTLLVDEAHNLVDRAREMFSAEIRKGTVLGLRRRLAGLHAPLDRGLTALNAELLAVSRQVAAAGAHCCVLAAPPAALVAVLVALRPSLEAVLARPLTGPQWEALIDFFFESGAFLRLAAAVPASHVCYAERQGRELRLRLYCVDPSQPLREALRRSGAAVFFSATLTPLEYFRELLGGQPDDGLLDLDSPFPAANLHVLVATHVVTTYRQRGSSYDDVAQAIGAAVAARPGHYMAFFPSYQYLQAVARRFVPPLPGCQVLVQVAKMGEPEREAFLARFAGAGDEPLVGFVVMGGLFGEGIDLVGDRLVGAIVVGVGLPQICPERDLIRQHFDASEQAGFDYAYTFPGMNRVLQAAGRVIRSETDRGVLLLLDERFDWEQYRRLQPRWWRPVYRVRQLAGLTASLQRFWRGYAEPHYEPLEE